MEGAEKLILLVGMGAEQMSLALVQLDLGCLDGSGSAPLLCDHGSNFSMHVMIALELSCDSPVFLGPGVVVHGCVCRVIGEAFKEPMGELPLFIDGDALWGEEFMLVDGLIDADGAQAIQSVQFDEWGEYMHGVAAIRNGDEEVENIPFIFFIAFRCSTLLLPLLVPLVGVFLPVLVSGFQVSCMHLMLCQVFSSLLEYFKLFLIVAANFLILSCNSCQSLRDEEEFLPCRCPMSFKSGAH